MLFVACPSRDHPFCAAPRRTGHKLRWPVLLGRERLHANVQVALVASRRVLLDDSDFDGGIDHGERLGQQLAGRLAFLRSDRAAQRADRVPEPALVLLIHFCAPLGLAHPLERGIRIRHLLTGILTESLSFYGSTATGGGS